MERYVDSDGSWAGTFARVMIDTGDPAPDEQLRADAAAGARSFLSSL